VHLEAKVTQRGGVHLRFVMKRVRKRDSESLDHVAPDSKLLTVESGRRIGPMASKSTDPQRYDVLGLLGGSITAMARASRSTDSRRWRAGPAGCAPRRFRGAMQETLHQPQPKEPKGHGCVYRTLSSPMSRSAGCVVASVHATSHGIQNNAATVWLRNVRMDCACFPLGHGMLTYRRTRELGGMPVIRAPLEPQVRDPQDYGGLRKGLLHSQYNRYRSHSTEQRRILAAKRGLATPARRPNPSECPRAAVQGAASG